MTLSPSERHKVCEMVAAGILDDLRANGSGALESFVTVPLSTAGALLGMGAKQVARRLPVVDIGDRKKGVSLAAIKAYQAAHTTQPEEAKP
jgi:hypothetical protein